MATGCGLGLAVATVTLPMPVLSGVRKLMLAAEVLDRGSMEEPDPRELIDMVCIPPTTAETGSK